LQKIKTVETVFSSFKEKEFARIRTWLSHVEKTDLPEISNIVLIWNNLNSV
jgi:hypothetical protein